MAPGTASPVISMSEKGRGASAVDALDDCISRSRQFVMQPGNQPAQHGSAGSSPCNAKPDTSGSWPVREIALCMVLMMSPRIEGRVAALDVRLESPAAGATCSASRDVRALRPGRSSAAATPGPRSEPRAEGRQRRHPRRHLRSARSRLVQRSASTPSPGRADLPLATWPSSRVTRSPRGRETPADVSAADDQVLSVVGPPRMRHGRADCPCSQWSTADPSSLVPRDHARVAFGANQLTKCRRDAFESRLRTSRARWMAHRRRPARGLGDPHSSIGSALTIGTRTIRTSMSHPRAADDGRTWSSAALTSLGFSRRAARTGHPGTGAT